MTPIKLIKKQKQGEHEWLLSKEERGNEPYLVSNVLVVLPIDATSKAMHCPTTSPRGHVIHTMFLGPIPQGTPINNQQHPRM
jgi:hypothetical protein